MGELMRKPKRQKKVTKTKVEMYADPQLTQETPKRKVLYQWGLHGVAIYQH